VLLRRLAIWRARIVLATSTSLGTVEIIRTAGVSKTALWRWQARFMDERVEGLLRDKTRLPGTPRLPLASGACGPKQLDS
jgi:hypothetical protein